MKKVYFISGLGADERAFTFLDLSFCDPVFIKWIAPQPKETLATYAERIFEIINDEQAVIIGLSFGGMLASEIAKNHAGTKAIIISSAKIFKEVPGYLRIWRYAPLYRLHTERNKKFLWPIVTKVLGVKGVKQKKVLNAMRKDSNAAFARWIISAILKWDNSVVPDNVIHIHGSADRLLPYRYVTAHHTIKGGGHVMLMNQSEEVSELLKQLITT